MFRTFCLIIITIQASKYQAHYTVQKKGNAVVIIGVNDHMFAKNPPEHLVNKNFHIDIAQVWTGRSLSSFTTHIQDSTWQSAKF